jgi:hypothetical protein
MFQRMIEDFKDSTGIALRMTFLVAAAALAMLITTCFLCAAAFVAVLEKYGPVAACLSGAAIFFVITLIAAGSYMARKRQAKLRAARVAQSARSTARSALADPMLLTAGLQIIRTVGIKRLIPILAIGGVALGIFAATRGAAGTDETSADEAPAE